MKAYDYQNAKKAAEMKANDFQYAKKEYTIAGPICESSDILAKKITLPKQQTGNYLAICDTGAYGAVMSSNYNT